MYFIPALALFLGLVAAVPTQSAPKDVKVLSVDANGSGCPAGTVTHQLDATGTLVEVIFSAYEVETGPGKPIDFKNCLISLNMEFDEGFQYVLDVQVCPYMHGNPFTNHAISGFPSSAPT